MDSPNKISMMDFENYKSYICHRVKEETQIQFILNVYESNEIVQRWENHEDAYALYLLAMVDYLSKLNDIPLYNKYDYIRGYRLSGKAYPVDKQISASVSGKNIDDLCKDAIPEFLKYNIVEGDIFNVI